MMLLTSICSSSVKIIIRSLIRSLKKSKKFGLSAADLTSVWFLFRKKLTLDWKLFCLFQSPKSFCKVFGLKQHESWLPL